MGRGEEGNNLERGSPGLSGAPIPTVVLVFPYEGILKVLEQEVWIS